MQLKPFVGIHYNPKKIKDLKLVFSPPYDIISDDEREILYTDSPYNIVRIIRGKEQPGDNGKNKYTRAASYYKKWVEKGVLIKSHKPRMYVYEQEYKLENGEKRKRKGFIAAMKVEPFETGNVLPHEGTFKSHKEDRLNLLRAAKANFGQIFTLFLDDKNIITEIIEQEAKKEPVLEFEDHHKVIHSLWNIEDESAIKKIQDEMKDKKAYIADGHHRYETAVNYMEEMKKPGSTGEEPYNYRIMTFINMESEGLIILPIHRLLHNLPNIDAEDIGKKTAEYFDLEKIDKDRMIKAIKDKKHCFGMSLNGNFYVLKLKNNVDTAAEIDHGHCSAWKNLDVTIIHKLFIEKVLNITKDIDKYVRYVDGDIHHAVDFMQKEHFQIGLFLNATRVDEVKEVANAHERMPQKSTYFYPKMISGIIINPLE